MAAGDITRFLGFQDELEEQAHNILGNTFKWALITSTVTPTVNATSPHFGGSGGINYSTNEISTGGNYVAGGFTVTGKTHTIIANVVTTQADKLVLAGAAGSATNARWVIIYNDSKTSKRAVAFIDLGAIVDLTAKNLEVRFSGVNGVGTIFTSP